MPFVAVLGLAACETDRAVPMDAAEPWHTEPEYRIGGLVDGNATFERVTGQRVGSGGTRVYVLDPGLERLTVWSPEGAQLLEVGWAGEEEGELDSPDHIELRDEGFQLRDGNSFVLFADDGQHRQTVSLPAAVGFNRFRLRPELMLPDGAFVVSLRIPNGVRAGWFGEDPVEEAPVLRLEPVEDRWELDSLAVLDIGNRDLDIRPGESDFGWSLHTAQPFGNADHLDLRAGSSTLLVTRENPADPGLVELSEISAAGDTVWSARLRFEPLPLLPADVDAALEAEARAVSGTVGSLPLDEAVALVREALYVPDYHPAVMDTEVMSNGQLWIRNHEEPGDTLDVWYTVRLGGENAAPRRILVPWSFYPFDATDTHVWGIRLDPEAGQQVVGRRLVRAGD
ncbi:MAG: hypothetical protein OXH49_07240 [Gemmatimonadetes bacterium]|nr:hypothetical protein [Gemmatimonadota bacterium]